MAKRGVTQCGCIQPPLVTGKGVYSTPGLGVYTTPQPPLVNWC